MSMQVIQSELLVELSEEQQELSCGGQYKLTLL
jgi:hypothetical protein